MNIKFIWMVWNAIGGTDFSDVTSKHLWEFDCESYVTTKLRITGLFDEDHFAKARGTEVILVIIDLQMSRISVNSGEWYQYISLLLVVDCDTLHEA